MKEIVADIFSRFLARAGTEKTLRVEHVTAVDDVQSIGAPIGTVLIVADDGTTVEPLAVIAIVPPNLAADDPPLLALVMRRALAHKAPYMLTWTLRDAVLWQTPRPGTPAERGSLKKVRDYEDEYDISRTPCHDDVHRASADSNCFDGTNVFSMT